MSAVSVYPSLEEEHMRLCALLIVRTNELKNAKESEEQLKTQNVQLMGEKESVEKELKSQLSELEDAKERLEASEAKKLEELEEELRMAKEAQVEAEKENQQLKADALLYTGALGQMSEILLSIHIRNNQQVEELEKGLEEAKQEIEMWKNINKAIRLKLETQKERRGLEESQERVEEINRTLGQQLQNQKLLIRELSNELGLEATKNEQLTADLAKSRRRILEMGLWKDDYPDGAGLELEVIPEGEEIVDVFGVVAALEESSDEYDHDEEPIHSTYQGIQKRPFDAQTGELRTFFG